MTKQFILFVAGNAVNVFVGTDEAVAAHVKANYAMAELVVVWEDKPNNNIKAAKAASIKLAKEAGIY